MQKKKICLFCGLLPILFLLAACGSSGVGTIPSGTPNRGNGTPAVLPTPKTTSQPVPTAPASAKGTTYAFVRNNQLWVALNGGSPAQVTHFDYHASPDVFWHQPTWSSGDRYLSFIMAARPVGQGGGGCPAPDYGANGALYLFDTNSQQLSTISPTSQVTGVVGTSPSNDFWQYVFWEDSTHLLAWYNGEVGKSSANAGLYRYDLVAGTLTQVVPLSALGVATLFSARPGLPLLLSMRYSNEHLFYQVVVHPFEQQSQFIIYSRSVTRPEMPSSKVLETGNEAWCMSQQSSPFVKPGWDVSVDGEQLIAQMITSGAAVGGSSQGVSTIEVLNLRDGATTTLFAQVLADVTGRDLSLTWGPDSQSAVLTAYNPSDQKGPDSATLADPAVTQYYAPNLPGQVTWRADSSAFALNDLVSGKSTTGASGSVGVYMFVPGQVQGQLLLAGAQFFVWG